MSARIVANNSEWTPDTIKKRGTLMIEFLWNKLHPDKQNGLTANEKLELLRSIKLLNVKMFTYCMWAF